MIKSVSELDFVEVCEECGLPSERVIRFKGNLIADNGSAYYNFGIGKVVRSRNDIRQELSRIKGETGRELVEVGNEVMKKTKPKRTELFSDEAKHFFKKEFNRGNRKH